MIMLARTGVGKTWFLVNVAVNTPTVPTVMFSLEMHARYVLERVASCYTNTDTRKIEASMMDHGRSAAVELATDELIRTYGSTQMDNVQGMARALKNFAREHDVALIVLHQVKRGEANAGHKPLDLTDGKFGGEESADYVLGMYKPSLNPNITQVTRDEMDNDIRLQFLKTRTGGGIQPDGVQHRWCPATGRITSRLLNYP